MTLAELKVVIAKFLGKTVADFSITDNATTVDFLLMAINSAKKNAQLLHDFDHARVKVDILLSGADNHLTGDISAAVLHGTPTAVSVKRLERAYALGGAGDFLPIDFLTEDEFSARVRRAVGREWTDPDVSLADLGFVVDKPILVQHGTSIFLVESPDITSENAPATVFDAIRFMPDYSGTVTTDFFLENGFDYLKWQAIYELNDIFKEFVPRQEGNIDPAEIQGKAAMALQNLIAWDMGIPDGTKIPQVPRPSFASAPKPSK